MTSDEFPTPSAPTSLDCDFSHARASSKSNGNEDRLTRSSERLSHLKEMMKEAIPQVSRDTTSDEQHAKADEYLVASSDTIPEVNTAASPAALQSITTTEPNSLLKPSTPAEEAQSPYTVFTRREKRALTLILCATTLVSPLTATSYLPLLPLLQIHFHTTQQAINLTITLYLIFQALSPMAFATYSDRIGRRLIYLITFAIFALASLGLALNDSSYAALLILRAMQSFGASSVVAVAYATVADVCVPAERGSMLGYIMVAANLGPCIGPLLGGGVAYASSGFIWVFWALFIFGATILIVLGLFFFETSRNVVGNGSITPKWWQLRWSSALTMRNKRETIVMDEQVVEKDQSNENRPRRASPLTAIRLIFWKDNFLILWIAGSFYAVYYCISAINPVVYKDTYGFNEIEIGLAYLPGGAGVIIGGFLTGRLMDWNYKATAKAIGHSVDRVRGDDLTKFPIEKARLRSSDYFLVVGFCALVGFGWSVKAHANPAVPMLLQCVLGIVCTFFLQTNSALIVDIHPETAGTAATSNNIIRCGLAATGVAVTPLLVRAMGVAWFFTFLGILSTSAGAAAIWALRRHGMEWRAQRARRYSPASDHCHEQANRC